MGLSDVTAKVLQMLTPFDQRMFNSYVFEFKKKRDL